jgi:hypothetical protein
MSTRLLNPCKRLPPDNLGTGKYMTVRGDKQRKCCVLHGRGRRVDVLNVPLVRRKILLRVTGNAS